VSCERSRVLVGLVSATRQERGGAGGLVAVVSHERALGGCGEHAWATFWNSFPFFPHHTPQRSCSGSSFFDPTKNRKHDLLPYKTSCHMTNAISPANAETVFYLMTVVNDKKLSTGSPKQNKNDNCVRQRENGVACIVHSPRIRDIVGKRFTNSCSNPKFQGQKETKRVEMGQ
jgi:hypothetical protein